MKKPPKIRTVFFLGFFSFVFGQASPLFAKNLIPSLVHPGRINWRPPPVFKMKLANGFWLYLLDDSSFPLFKANLYVKTGGIEDPPHLTGLSEIAATLLVTGGTKDKTPKEVDEWLDQRAIHLEADSDEEITSLTISSLAHQWEESLNFLGEVLLNPRWDTERFQLAIRRYKEGIRRDKDKPGTVLSQAFRQTLYGEKHPWARVPTKKSLSRMRVRDIESFYQKYYHPNRMILAVAGDFSKPKIIEWFRKWGAKLKEVPVQEIKFTPLPFETKPETKRIKKKVSQAFIEAGHFSLIRHAKERYAYTLLQYILGGDPFTSRLGREIRSEKGLAYSVYSTWDATPVRGSFRVHVETKTQSEAVVLNAIRGHLVRFAKGGDITPIEVKRGKEAILNNYIFWFDSPFKVVFMQAKFDLLGYPKDYLYLYPKRIEEVRLEEIRETAKKFINPDGLKVVIVGP